jgi:thiol:disulfide interchange protein
MARIKGQSTCYIPRALLAVTALSAIALITDLAASHAGFGAPGAGTHLVFEEMRAKENPLDSMKPMQEVVPEMTPQTAEAFAALLDEAKKEKKIVLYEFAADWSDPCKKMENSSFGNKQVEEFINAHCIPVRVTDRMKEAGRNPHLVTELQKKFRVFAFPTLVAVDSKGSTVGSLVGSCSSLTTYRFLSRAVASCQ